MSTEAMKQWLEALETPRPLDDYPPVLKAYAKTINDAITSIRQAIAETEKQEPVAVVQDLDEVKRKHLVYECGFDWKDPLYTRPQPKREWVGLTDEEIGDLKGGYQSGRIGSFVELTQAIEAKLKEKNT